LSEQLERYRWLVVGLFAVPLLSGIAFLLSDRLGDPDPIEVKTGDTAGADIRVYISGAVQNPGVYAADQDDRWIDVLESAGGAAPDADLDAVNLSKRVEDEDQIIVPRVGSVAVSGVSRSPLININTASESALKELPGIGEVRASQIVQSRTADGPFVTIDDLLTRELVSKSVFEDIAPLITVAP
jgi:competence protein ComEA